MTMKRKPRPKSEPIIMPWMWRSIVANGVFLTVSIFCTYILALHAYAGAYESNDITDATKSSCSIWPRDKFTPEVISCGKWVKCSSVVGITGYDAACATWMDAPEYKKQAGSPAWYTLVGESPAGVNHIANYGALWQRNTDCEIFIETSIRRARTACFISLVWAENLRAYVSRSFDQGIWVGTFDNTYMNIAILLAQCALYLVLYVPGLNTVLGLHVDEIHGFGWFIAVIGAVSTTVFCEIYKYFSARFVKTAELAEYDESQETDYKHSDSHA